MKGSELLLLLTRRRLNAAVGDRTKDSAGTTQHNHCYRTVLGSIPDGVLELGAHADVDKKVAQLNPCAVPAPHLQDAVATA